MGNDGSKLKGVQIDKSAVEANDFWTLFNAELPTTTNEEGRRQLLSIFQGEAVVNGQLWVAQGPLERAIRNFMIYRHPYILKYVATWEQGGQKHLATERVRPLSAVLAQQSDIQVCLGLRTILCSLIFLTEKALARHLNICISSVYITDNGSWRLAGFEYVWKPKEVTKTLFDLANAYRYQPAIDPHETKEANSEYMEQYAFASLCEEVLAKCTTSEAATPHALEFREYCATHLKHKSAQLRPRLSAVLLHPYFNHEFVLIHSFLFELPLKGVQQRQDFFTSLIDRLRQFSEDVVGSQLAADLLSRMVLLDPTAQLCVTPYVLRTRADHPAALFSQATYVRHVMPHIQRMFRLRDAQIRLILLEYFMEFVRLLTQQDVTELILPHLLAGMNDTNDVLVAKTLRCLADLVPILGAAAVIGGQRLRLFSDGRPQAAVADATAHWVEPRSITPVMGGGGGGGEGGDEDDDSNFMVSGSPLPPELGDDEEQEKSNKAAPALAEADHFNGSCNSLPAALLGNDSDATTRHTMPPRLSPDGGEDERTTAVVMDGRLGVGTTTLSSTATATTPNSHRRVSQPAVVDEHKNDDDDDEEEEAWSDWEADELQRLHAEKDAASYATALPSILPDTSTATDSHILTATPCSVSATTTTAVAAAKLISDDLSALDIQVLATPTQSDRPDEFDFFKDMQPVIERRTATKENFFNSDNEEIAADDEEVRIDSSRFAARAPSLDEIKGLAALANAASELNGLAGGGGAATDGWGMDDDDDEDEVA